MFSEDDLLPISALQHMLYCPRQCALIHIERLWAENRLTVEGKHLHERADSGRPELRGGVRILRSVQLRSLKLGLYGIADVVEARPIDGGGTEYHLVEYKRGKPKRHDADRVQICAQALCLEEMLGTTLADGDLFYGKTRRRVAVAFDPTLREQTIRTTELLHAMIASGHTPAATYEKEKCDRCSLINLCLPKAAGEGKSASRYLSRTLAYLNEAAPPSDN
jgi:CRISPR-associated exonuclease Cas4